MKRRLEPQEYQSLKKRKLNSGESLPTKIDPSASLQEELGFKLITHPLDKPELVKVGKVDIINQYGAYAKQFIRANTSLGVYTGKLVTPEEVDPRNGYCMHITKKSEVDASKYGNFTRLINHSEYRANVEFKKEEHENEAIVMINSIKDIAPGEQLLVDYGPHYIFEGNTIFLNQRDNAVSAEIFYQNNNKFYELQTVKTDFPRLNLYKNDILAMPKLPHMPVFKTQGNDHVHAYSDFECTCKLKWFAYMGDKNKVSALLNLKADVNLQQHRTGYTPLHLAVFGYEELNKTQQDYKERQDTYVAIIKTLLVHGADVCIADKEENIALYYAMLHFNPSHLQELVDSIPEEQFNKLFEIVDKKGRDILYNAIENKKLDNLMVLLPKQPNYFINSFADVGYKNGGKNSFYYDSEKFKNAIKKYSPEEIQKFLEIIDPKQIHHSYIVMLKKRQKKLNEATSQITIFGTNISIRNTLRFFIEDDPNNENLMNRGSPTGSVENIKARLN